MVKLKKIAASTLIEVIVAMIIITLITGMSSAFIIQSFKKTNISYHAKAFLLLDNEVELSEREKDFTDMVKEIDGLRIERTTSENKYGKQLKTVSFKISDDKGNLLLKRTMVLKIKE